MALRGGLEELKTYLKALFALAMGAVTIWSFHIPPDLEFQRPALARIFVWHFPCPMIASVLLFFNAWYSFQYLRTRQLHWDERASASQELAYIFSLLTMATGMLFSKVQWGAWWQWDPRQTSFLLVLLIYGAYFIMRGAFQDAEQRAANTAAYALAALLPAIFLIFVFPYLPQVKSFHPTGSIFEGKIKGEYAYVVTSTLTLTSILTAWLYRIRVGAGLMRLEWENTDERMDVRGGGPAPSGVVRRISVSAESRAPTEGA